MEGAQPHDDGTEPEKPPAAKYVNMKAFSVHRRCGFPGMGTAWGGSESLYGAPAGRACPTAGATGVPSVCPWRFRCPGAALRGPWPLTASGGAGGRVVTAGRPRWSGASLDRTGPSGPPAGAWAALWWPGAPWWPGAVGVGLGVPGPMRAICCRYVPVSKADRRSFPGGISTAPRPRNRSAVVSGRARRGGPTTVGGGPGEGGSAPGSGGPPAPLGLQGCPECLHRADGSSNPPTAGPMGTTESPDRADRPGASGPARLRAARAGTPGPS